MLSRRLEVKYVVDRTTRTALARDLACLMRPDGHAGAEGAYLVRSLYLDTPDFMNYQEKLAGLGARHKLRVRAYGDDPREADFLRLEVKSRVASFIRKIAVDIPTEKYADVEPAIRRRILPPEWLRDDPDVPQEFFRLQRQYNMEPKVLLQYRRQAFERREIGRIRVNFDDELVATRNLDLLGPLQGARRILQYGHAIFEVKVDGSLPSWMHMLIAKYNLQNQAVSKYCFAVRSEARLSCNPRADLVMDIEPGEGGFQGRGRGPEILRERYRVDGAAGRSSPLVGAAQGESS